MTETHVDKSAIDRLEAMLRDAHAVPPIVQRTLGGMTISNGIWRFYSETFPGGGCEAWNRGEWRAEWDIPPTAYFIGEDVFGNQLATADGIENVAWWDHENGDFVDLELDIVTLLRATLEGGLHWLDVYADVNLESMGLAISALTMDQHLHWIDPLILGGRAVPENARPMDREEHLIGHAKIWAQIKDVAPGTRIV